MSSAIFEICDSKHENLFNLNLFFNDFIPIIFSNLDKSLIGPLCFIRPSKVSKDKFNPSKSIYFFSINITILRVCKL